MNRKSATEVELSCPVTKTPDAVTRRYRENRHWRLYPNEWIYRNIPIQGEDVLDFGCGTGEFSTKLAMFGAKRVIGLDVTPGLLELTQKRARLDGVEDKVDVLCGDLRNLYIPAVDVILAFAVLHHCHPVATTTSELLQRLKPNGWFVCCEPVCYVPAIEWLREQTGVPMGPLDEGEAKLSGRDVRDICGALVDVHIQHYRILGRLDRYLPDLPLRLVDRVLVALPEVWKLSGQVLIAGRKAP